MSVGFVFKSLLHEKRIVKKAMLVAVVGLAATPHPLSADTANNNGCLHSISLSHSSLCVWPILASGRGEGGEPKTELGFLYFSLFHVLRILMSSMFFPTPAYFMETYKTSWFFVLNH
jgi:hypothetical protein